MRRAQARARIAIATATIAALQGKRNLHAITRLHHRHLPQLGRDGQQQRLKKVPVFMYSQAPQALRLRRQAAAAIAKQQRRHEEELHLFTGKGRGRRGSASLRRADAAQVCNNGGFVSFDGIFECSVAIAARQIVSERW